MKKVFTHVFMMAALLVAGNAFVSCDKENIATEYTMTVVASKGDNGAKNLILDGHTLNAEWATTENVYVKKGSSWATGSLQPQSAGVNTTLDGTLSDIEISATDELTLQFPKSGDISYDGQVGTLADIAANFDYATATVTVANVNGGNITTTGSANFVNQQAIVKFTLLDKGNSDAAISPSALTISDGTHTISLTSIPAATYTANGSGVLYVALPAVSDKPITLTATVGDDTYTYTTSSNKTFANGQYYEITVKMTKQVPAAKPAAEATAEDKGKLIGTDGNIYTDVAAATAAGTTAVAKIIYIGTTGHATYSHGLALALTDEASKMAWQDAIDACSAKNESTPVTGATWLLASQAQWDYMLGTDGAGSHYDLRDGFSSVGGSNMQWNYYYSSTEDDSDTDYAWYYSFAYGIWLHVKKGNTNYVRACLAF